MSEQPNKWNCYEYQDLLADVVDVRSTTASDVLSEHIDHCDTCQGLMADMREAEADHNERWLTADVNGIPR